MKLTLTTAFAALFATTAVAGPFGLPDHQADGYRDTGCEIDQQVQITNDAGEYLYSNNPTCPTVGGANGLGLVNDAAIEALRAARQEENGGGSEEPIDCKGCEIATK